MSEGQSGNGPSKGSVRRAREMAEGTPQPKIQTSNRQPPPLPAAFKSLDQGPKGAVISKPTPMPQWPLPDGSKRDNTSSPEDMKGPAPQRPPRPGNVPSLLDASKVREYTPAATSHKPTTALQTQEDSPSNSHPETSNVLSPASTQEYLTSPHSARPSTTSSVGTIPDFPLPAVQTAQPTQPSGRKTSNLGPPPTTRRGASSFYSASSYVSPIPEEFTESGPKSFASSKVMPSSWGSAGIIDAYQDSHDSDSSDSSPSVHDDGEVTLVRQASLGKRARPALRTINKSQGDNSSSDSESKSINSRDKAADSSPPGPTAAVPASGYSKTTGQQTEVGIPRQPKHERSYSSSSESSADEDLEKPPIPMTSHGTLEATMKELELEDMGRGNRRANQRKLDAKRPPRLDIEAVREAEERGSLTSLPDLIRRATRLASNLDNGRTASRLGILDMLNANANGDMKRTGPRNSGSISDILASFPPPGAAGPNGDHRGTGWPGQYDHRANPDAVFPADHPDAGRKAGRRCCGMRRWVFILLCLVIVVVIAAAIVVPIMLLVVPRNEETATQPSNTPLATDTCEAIQPCQNGGVSIGSLDSCRCVCVDGFRGSGCAVSGDGSCATLDISDETTDYPNATLGSALPRLFEEAANNFSIPLNASKILSLFNAEDVSCTSENAIVTFNGYNRKRELFPDLFAGVHTGGPSKRRGQKHRRLAARQKGFEAVQDPEPTKTGKPTKPTRTAVPSSTPTSTSSPSPPITDRVLDFGRIAVLFILERTEEFQDATTAHDSIQRFFRNVSNGSAPQDQDEDEDGDEEENGLDQSMGVECDSQEFSLDFINFTIELGDGTVVGGEQGQG